MNPGSREWVAQTRAKLDSMSLGMIDLTTERGRKRFFNKALRKYSVKELLIALMEQGVTLSPEQEQMLGDEKTT